MSVVTREQKATRGRKKDEVNNKEEEEKSGSGEEEAEDDQMEDQKEGQIEEAAVCGVKEQQAVVDTPIKTQRLN